MFDNLFHAVRTCDACLETFPNLHCISLYLISGWLFWHIQAVLYLLFVGVNPSKTIFVSFPWVFICSFFLNLDI